MSSYLNNSRMPEPRMYSHHDLFPGKWDPRCSPQFPLGNFWPVYVGNFWCDKYPEHATKVQEYFASKGLLVRMVFGRSEKDDPHLNYQRNHRLYDFLAYFVRQKDAEDAVNYCHREMYYGHRLNVFPGREPLYFDHRKSVKHAILQPPILPMTEQVYENYLQTECSIQVECIVQHNKRDLLVEYGSVRDRNTAILNCQICKPKLVPASQRKQRFIEQGVEQEICNRIRDDPSFVKMLPSDLILEGLYHGNRYNDYQWQTAINIKMPRRMRLIGKRDDREQLHMEAFESASRNFGVRCTCKVHARKSGKRRGDQSNVKPAAFKEAEPSSGDVNIRNEVAAINAATEPTAQPSVTKVEAPGVDQRVGFAGDNFHEDSYDIDHDLGSAF